MIFCQCSIASLRREIRLGRGFLVISRLAVFLTVAIPFASTANEAVAQVRVTAMWRDNSAVKEGVRADEVTCKHDDWSEEKVYVGMVLNHWDEISCPSASIIIELTAPNKSLFKASDQFSFLLKPSGAKDIIIKVNKGAGEMQSSGGGEVSGEAGIVVIKTEYSVRVRRTPQGLQEDYIVFEGDVGVTPAARFSAGFSEATMRVATGQKLRVVEGGLRRRVTKLTAEDISKSASVYARIDTAKALMKNNVDPKETYANLLGRYEAVFREPTNANNRIQLAVDQVNLDVSEDALYQLQKAEQFTPPDQNATRAVIAVAKVAAFTQTGNQEAAQQEIQKARTFDASAFDETKLRLYRFNDKTRNQLLQHKSAPVPERDGPTGEDFRREILRSDGGGAWPIPLRLTAFQRKMFDLINARRFNEALHLMAETGPVTLESGKGEGTSIDAYIEAIVSYELKNPGAASTSAAVAMKKSGEDKLLSRAVYAAAQEIFKATRRRQ